MTTTGIDTTRARTALLALHRQLLHAQRIEAERDDGRMSSAVFLQAATEDLRFGWLTRLSDAIARLDQARADDDAAALDAALADARGLIHPPDEATPFGRLYLRALQNHPDVVLAHRDATLALGA